MSDRRTPSATCTFSRRASWTVPFWCLWPSARPSAGCACLVREDHPDVGDTLSLETFARLSHALISPRGSGPSFVDDALAALGLSRRIALRIPFFLAAPMIIARSDLILTAPRRVALQFAKTLPLRVMEPPLPLASFGVHLVWHERDDADPAHAWLRKTICRAAGVATEEGAEA